MLLLVKKIALLPILFTALFLIFGSSFAGAQQADGSIGVEAQIPSPAPTVAATISTPSSGTIFGDVPITVSGVCQTDLVVRLFKNGVFSGSALCENGSYSIQTDLFDGDNEFVAIVFDALDQEGPESNRVVVSYNDPSVSAPVQHVALTSNFARRGADPGQEIIWPISISGGTGPYAVSINWGDGLQNEELISVASPGEFDARHIYERAGSYTIIVKATDSEGRVGYLQLVGVANGAIESLAETGALNTTGPTQFRDRIILWPVLLLIPVAISTFWLGSHYRLKRIKDKIRRGELPFSIR